ncbi:hypothetical protein [Pseudonocardia kongjuensis]|uniref:hypothetical protein n=1 Tax=Pseudonocardia kongjuensis TaxID=102227 RepID=UPI0031DFED94
MNPAVPTGALLVRPRHTGDPPGRPVPVHDAGAPYRGPGPVQVAAALAVTAGPDPAVRGALLISGADGPRAVVLGPVVAPLAGPDLRLVGCTVHVGGLPAGTGAGAAAVPASGPWAVTAGHDPGVTVLFGPITAPAPATGRTTATAVFGRGLGPVTVRLHPEGDS